MFWKKEEIIKEEIKNKIMKGRITIKYKEGHPCTEYFILDIKQAKTLYEEILKIISEGSESFIGTKTKRVHIYYGVIRSIKYDEILVDEDYYIG